MTIAVLSLIATNHYLQTVIHKQDAQLHQFTIEFNRLSKKAFEAPVRAAEARELCAREHAL